MEPWVIVLIIFIVVIVVASIVVYKNRGRILAILPNKEKNKQSSSQSQSVPKELDSSTPIEAYGSSENDVYNGNEDNMSAVGANFL